MDHALDPAAMYRAFLDRDPAYDGLFFVGVKTTGIFCRPTCPARRPLAANVAFFASAADARRAGYRACKRCRPVGSPVPDWAGELIGRVDRDPTARWTDSDLTALEIDPARARRYFLEHFGMTFHAYHRSRRMGLALAEIRDGGDLLDVGRKHGFESASGFRDAFGRLFGEPPGRGRAAASLLARWIETPLGTMIAAANDDGLALLEFVDRRSLEAQFASLRRHFGAAIVPGTNAILDQVAAELAGYFAGELRAFAVPILDPASPFQREVWDVLKAIPFGQTASYAQIARSIQRPGASRAVGRANGENRLAIVIPCHRVVRADGQLCGYAGGLDRKRWLLDHERGVVGGDEVAPGWLFATNPAIMDPETPAPARDEVPT